MIHNRNLMIICSPNRFRPLDLYQCLIKNTDTKKNHEIKKENFSSINNENNDNENLKFQTHLANKILINN